MNRGADFGERFALDVCRRIAATFTRSRFKLHNNIAEVRELFPAAKITGFRGQLNRLQADRLVIRLVLGGDICNHQSLLDIRLFL